MKVAKVGPVLARALLLFPLIVAGMARPGPAQSARERCHELGKTPEAAPLLTDVERLTADSLPIAGVADLLLSFDSLRRRPIVICARIAASEQLDPKVRGDAFAQLGWITLQNEPSYSPIRGSDAADTHREGLERALRFFEKSTELDPKHATAFKGMSRVLARLERPQESIARFREHVALNDRDAEVHYELGQMLSGRGLDAEANDAFRRAIDRKPDHIRSWLGLARTSATDYERWTAYRGYLSVPLLRPSQSELEEWFQASAEFEALPRRMLDACSDALARQDSAHAACTQSAEIYTQLSDSLPENPYYRSGLGRVLQLKGQKSKADAAYRLALSRFSARVKRDPSDTASWKALGEIQRWRGRPAESYAAYKKLVELQPRAAAAWGALALAADALKRPKEAAHAFEKALELDAHYFENRGLERELWERLRGSR